MENIVLNLDGSLQRRLGINLEANFQTISTSISNANIDNVAITTFKWENAGGDPNKNIGVVQVGNEIMFFNLIQGSSVSPNLLYQTTLPIGSTTNNFSYSVVDGILVIVNGEKNPITIEFEAPNIFTQTQITLFTRDLWGIYDEIGGVDLYQGSGLQVRPAASTDSHNYNLVNQGWGVPRVDGNNETLEDPITAFTTASGGPYPSNSDIVISTLYPDPEDTDNRTIDRFFAEDLYKNPLGSTKAAQGYFIIDVLERGPSRLTNFQNNKTTYPDLDINISTIPQDITPGGPTVVGEYAGRIWYGGFSGVVTSGDDKSPRLSSYIFFSKLVNSIGDINQCYQEGDPTSKFNADIVDTDGGFIRINEAYGIKKFESLGASQMIVASNGIWRVVGGTDSGFTATNYIIEKLTSHGCESTDSIVVAEGSIFYWGEDGIYQLTTDQFGGWTANSLSKGRIQKLFDAIDPTVRLGVKGHYDSFERKIRWIYNNRTNDTDEVMELVLDVALAAFYPNRIKNLSNDLPRVISPYLGEPYVIVSSDPSAVYRREIGYVAITRLTPTLQFSFATYRDQDFLDWVSADGVGVDAHGFAVTSYLSGTDFLREKEIPFLVTHLRKTETGFEDVSGELIPLNQSSCMIQVRWDWSNSMNSNRWSSPFQAYRHRRHYLPVDVNDSFDNGFLTVSTKNKIRGNGKVLSIKFYTEADRDLHLFGWSMLFSVAGTA